MAEYHFDNLAKRAGIENSAPSAGVSPEEAEREMERMKFRFSVTDGYLVEKGGQFDYVFDFSRKTYERSDWRRGLPVVTKGEIPGEAADDFVKSISFILTLSQTHFVTDTKSMEVNTNAWEREKYGPIKRYTRCEVRMGERFFRWVAEKDGDTPFKELYAALSALRRSVDSFK